jgi:hypothetical protein
MNPNGLPFIMLPPWFQQPQQQQYPPGYDHVPARVRLAIQFLNDLTHKGTTVSMTNMGSDHTIEGQELLPVEHQAQAEACKMLSAYFRGELQPSSWEVALMRQSCQGVPVPMVACPICLGSKFVKGQPCRKCNGKGIMVVDIQE